MFKWREGGREGGREEGREGGREGRRDAKGGTMHMYVKGGTKGERFKGRNDGRIMGQRRQKKEGEQHEHQWRCMGIHAAIQCPTSSTHRCPPHSPAPVSSPRPSTSWPLPLSSSHPHTACQPAGRGGGAVPTVTPSDQSRPRLAVTCH